MGTHLSVLSESFPMNTNMTVFQWFSKNFAFSGLEGLRGTLEIVFWIFNTFDNNLEIKIDFTKSLKEICWKAIINTNQQNIFLTALLTERFQPNCKVAFGCRTY